MKVTKNEEFIATLSQTSQKTLKSMSRFATSINILLSSRLNIILSQIDLISSQSFKEMSDQKNAENHIFIRFSSMKSQRIMKKNTMNEIDLSSDEEIVSTQISQSDLLINIAIKKLITIEIIVEKMNKINIQHAKKWIKKIEFLKQIRENAELNIHDVITTRINEVKRIVKIETTKRDEIKESMKHFLKTQEKIFKHNRDETLKILKNWRNLKNKTTQLMKKNDKLKKERLNSKKKRKSKEI